MKLWHVGYSANILELVACKRKAHKTELRILFDPYRRE